VADREGVDVSQPVTVVCPRQGCHCQFELKLRIPPNVTLETANGASAFTHCPRCGLRIDLLPGGGTFAAVGGRLRRIADALVQVDPQELERLRSELQEARTHGEQQRAEALLTEQEGLREVLRLWRPTTHDQFWALVDRILKALLVLATVVGGAVQADDVAGAVAEQLRPPPPAQPGAEPAPAPEGPER
jgi:hypothetical protein